MINNDNQWLSVVINGDLASGKRTKSYWTLLEGGIYGLLTNDHHKPWSYHLQVKLPSGDFPSFLLVYLRVRNIQWKIPIEIPCLYHGKSWNTGDTQKPKVRKPGLSGIQFIHKVEIMEKDEAKTQMLHGASACIQKPTFGW